MKDFLIKLWKNEEGAETAEWIVIVALIVVVAIALYNGVLRTALTNAVNFIDAQITGATSGG